MQLRLTCKQAISLLTDYEERALPWAQRVRTGWHLYCCPGCLEFSRELRLLGGVYGRFVPLDAAGLEPIGEAALAYAMAHLGDDPKGRRLPKSNVPPELRALLASEADLALRLMAETHAALMAGQAPREAPFLPGTVLAQLPPERQWRWRTLAGGARRARLWARAGGPSLSLLYMPPGFTSGRHAHEGTESILVLEGELEHAERCLSDGDWIHLERGTIHAPHAFASGCWCLVRDEGTQRHTGFLGRIKDLLPS